MRLPDFLIIGAAKSGTTTLYKYLSRHPQIYMSLVKEPQFFAVDDKYVQGLEWYGSLFSEALPHQICGEASTDYTKYPRYPETAARIAQTIPNVKMIYLMRHPVDRAYSYYVHLNRNSKIEETFEEHLSRTSFCFDGSNYMMQIKQYLSFFSRESFLFLLMEELINYPRITLDKVCVFLGIDNNIELSQEENIIANSYQNFFRDTIRGKITTPLKEIPGVAQIANLLPQKGRDWIYKNILKNSFYGQQIQKQHQPLLMKPETRQMLIEKFLPLNNELAQFLDQDLSHWNK